MMSAALLLSMSVGHGYELNTAYNYYFGYSCGGSVSLPGNSAGYYMFPSDAAFTSAERDAIEAGLEAWHAGPGTINRGADFEFVNVGERGTQSFTNSYNEIWHMTHQEGINLFAFPTPWAAITKRRADPGCVTVENFDIILASDLDWYISVLPSKLIYGTGSALTNEYNLTAVMLHEGGHGLAFDHEVDRGGAMTRNQFAEHGLALRLGEDDYDGLRNVKPMASNTGKNFMLTRWENPTGRSREIRWDDDEADDWLPACGTVVVGLDSPKKVNAVVNGTASLYHDVPIEWTLSSDPICFDADDILIGQRTPDMKTNKPYEVGPSGGVYVIPASTPDDDYWVCAGINPDHTWSEAQSSFIDNVIISEGQWTIDCP